MQTVRIDIPENQWVEILQGAHSAFFDVVGASSVYVHYSTSDIAPDSDAPCHEVLSHPATHDWGISGVTGSQRVWVRGKDYKGAALVVSKQ